MLVGVAVLALCACDPPPANSPASGADAATAAQPQVRGRLVWNAPRYQLVVTPTGPGDLVILDLWISENKVLVRRLEELRDQEVVVTGTVVRVPKGSSAAEYTNGFTEFDIRAAP
jgi:hypothetical protein